MYVSEELQKKWQPVLEHPDLEAIKDPHRRAVTSILLENQEKFLAEQSAFENGTSMLTEAAPTNSGNAVGASGAVGASDAVVAIIHAVAATGSTTYLYFFPLIARCRVGGH